LQDCCRIVAGLLQDCCRIVENVVGLLKMLQDFFVAGLCCRIVELTRKGNFVAGLLKVLQDCVAGLWN
jgi:ABC-type uncharacterized transport system permease subunit